MKAVSTVAITSVVVLAGQSVAQNATAGNGTYASQANLTLVAAQYNASGFNYHIGSSQSFGIPLQNNALLQVAYPGIGLIQNGAAYTAAQVATRPTVQVLPAQGANYSTSSRYTLMLADASALGNIDPEGDYRHYLANNLTVASGYTGSGVANLTNGTVITYYAGPGPIAGTGIHRYAWLLFSQPSNFTAPANLSTTGVSPGHWIVNDYVVNSRLGALVAASFFTVQNGNPTAAVVTTTAINTATLIVPTASAAGVAGADASPTGKPNSASSTTGSAKAASALVLALIGGYFFA